MKTLNLVMAIIYTVILVWVFLAGFADGDLEISLGAILLSGPVIVNWITFSNLKKK